jgi:hypothetical protein
MANMSYCRFHNTVIDLEDCINTLEGYNEGELKDLSEDEKRAINKLLGRQLERLNEIKDLIDEDYAGDVDKWLEEQD